MFVLRFDCSEIQAFSTDECHLKGKSYKVGEQIEDELAPMCRASCRCDDRFDGISIICADVECPEHLDYDPSSVPLYDDLNECCSLNIVSGEQLIF